MGLNALSEQIKTQNGSSVLGSANNIQLLQGKGLLDGNSGAVPSAAGGMTSAYESAAQAGHATQNMSGGASKRRRAKSVRRIRKGSQKKRSTRSKRHRRRTGRK